MGFPPPTAMRALLLALAFALLRSCAAQTGTLIGSLSELQHDVRGQVFAIDSRTLEVRNFDYDGRGPRAFFWVGRGTPSSAGFAILVTPTCGTEALPRFSGATVRVELPAGTTVADIDYLSVWCEAADANFGSVPISAASVAAVPSASGPASCDSAGTFPVQSGFNCEVLNEFLQVRWQIAGANINVELVGKVRQGQYMGFGVSGSDTGTAMVNSDVVIATELEDGTIQAEDYFMNSRGQCASGGGVCPDTVSSSGPGRNDVTGVSGNRTLDTLQVRFTRPLAASQPATDRAFRTGAAETTYVTWATGPFNRMSNVPQIHVGEMAIPRTDVGFVFGRAAQNNCQTPLIAMEEKEEVAIEPWTRRTISNVTDITARIGPSGERRGVAGITGGSSWGIAWYMSPTGTTGQDRLIPAIAVERNKTYTFRVFGGNNASESAMHHPLYITADPDGGFATKMPVSRADERIFAGINVTRREPNRAITNFTAPAMGRLCQFDERQPVEDVNAVETFQEYFRQLDTSCAASVPTAAAGVLQWTVPGDAPDVLYYQCATHRDLGFKLVVFDEGRVDETRLRLESGGGPVSCNAVFNRTTLTFESCADITPSFRVFWTLSADSIDTLFVATTASGWAGFAWGSSEMVGANAVIAYRLANGTAGIDDYFLRARSSAGVQPAGNQNLNASQVDVGAGTIAGRFTRPLTGPGIPSLSPADTNLIWAIGPESPSGTALRNHGGGSRGRAVVNLASKGGQAGVGQQSNTRAIFLAHGALMGIAWIVLVPTAVIFMRFFKSMNPVTFQVHRGLNALAVVAVLIAFIMGVVEGSHDNTRHLAIGCVVTILAVLQAVNGTLRPGHGTSSRKPWFLLHAYSGRLALLLAAINVFFGIDLAVNFTLISSGWRVAAGVIIGVMVAIVVLLSLFPSKFPVTAQDEPIEAYGEEEEGL